ncbi:TrfB-related DNA-binding protein [Massilia sp.]|uniref:TrfB-related DNA-binding protein n=1 Tax=Massilia sp. TaxID=1882437 RepID=UPI00352C9BBF
MKLKRITPDRFNHLASQTRLKENARQLAYGVLVEGNTPAVVASKSGMTHQRVLLAVAVIERAYFADKSGDGMGWVSLQMDAPESVALQLDDLFQTLKDVNDETKETQVAKLLLEAVVKARRLLS